MLRQQQISVDGAIVANRIGVFAGSLHRGGPYRAIRDRTTGMAPEANIAAGGRRAGVGLLPPPRAVLAGWPQAPPQPPPSLGLGGAPGGWFSAPRKGRPPAGPA